MISYDDEAKELNIINNKKNIYRKIIYKLTHDENIKLFKSKFLNNIENFNYLNNVEKFHFKDDIENYYKITNFLVDTILKDLDFKNYTEEDFYKCCNVFPDHLGEQFIEHISYLPIIKYFRTIRKKEELINNLKSMENYQIEKPSWWINREKDRLEDFIDEIGQIEFLKDQISKMDNIINEEHFNILLIEMKETDNIKQIGMIYLKSLKDQKELEVNNLKNVLNILSSKLKNNSDENIKK
jgi:hypothetical protein